MTRLVAVVAHDSDALFLNLVLGAFLRNVAQLVAVGALGQSALDSFTGVSEALQVLFCRLGPIASLSGAEGLVGPSVMDAILLVQIALEIHVRVSRENRRIL